MPAAAGGIAPARLHRAAAPGRAARRPAGCGRRSRRRTASSAKRRRARSKRCSSGSCSVPEPSEEACRRHYAAHAGRLPDRRARAGTAYPVRRDARAWTSWPCASAPKPIFARRALPRRQGRRPVRRRGAQVVQLPQRRARAATWAGSCAADCAPEFARELFGHAEVGVLPRLVHSRFGLHVVEVLEREPGVAQPFEAVRGAVANVAASAGVRHGAAPVPAPAGRRRRGGRRGPRRGRHAAGAVAWSIASFEDLLRAARAQAEPQRLLFVFASAVLPEDSTPEQRAGFAAGQGGALEPLMSVDKAPEELGSFAALVEESRQFGPDWSIVFVASLARAQRPRADERGSRALVAGHDRVDQGRQHRRAHPVRPAGRALAAVAAPLAAQGAATSGASCGWRRAGRPASPVRLRPPRFPACL